MCTVFSPNFLLLLTFRTEHINFSNLRKNVYVQRIIVDYRLALFITTPNALSGYSRFVKRLVDINWLDLIRLKESRNFLHGKYKWLIVVLYKTNKGQTYYKVLSKTFLYVKILWHKFDESWRSWLVQRKQTLTVAHYIWKNGPYTTLFSFGVLFLYRKSLQPKYPNTYI